MKQLIIIKRLNYYILNKYKYQISNTKMKTKLKNISSGA